MVEQQQNVDREQEFARIKELLAAFAKNSGGKYDAILGIDPKEIQAIENPFFNLMTVVGGAGLGEPRDEDAVLKQFSQHYSNAVDWEHRAHKIRLLVRKITGSNPETSGKKFVFPLQFRCVIQPKGLLSLILVDKRQIKQGRRPTGSGRSLHLPEYARFFCGKGIVSVFDAAPIFTYYCPFGRGDIENKYLVRSSPVTFGNAFVQDTLVIKTLEQDLGIESLRVGPHDWRMGGEDNVVILDAVDPKNSEQLQSLLDLVLRTLDLLEQTKLIE